MPIAEIHLGPFALEHPSGLIATLIGFALLIFLFVKLGATPVRGILTDRTTRIETAHTDAERHLTEARQIRDDYSGRIAQIETEHRARLDAAVRDADAARAQIIADADQAARALQRRTEEEMGRERTRQRILMRRQIVQITLDAAEQAIQDLDSEKVQRQLIAEFVTQVSATSTGGARAYDAGAATARDQTGLQGGA